MDDTTAVQALVGGYRSGKSVAGTWKSLRCAVELFPGEHGVMLAPVTGMNQRNIVPILRKILPTTGLDYDVEALANKRVDHLDIKVGSKISRIWLGVSAENYTRMNGMSLAWGYFDEADLCRNSELAYDSFVELGNRLSESENALQFATSTPEGYGFMHKRFVEEAAPDTKIWHVKMTDNFLLPKGYVEKRLRMIPANKQAAYINGQFSNIFTSTVYSCFDRELNNSTETLEKYPRAPIHWGMDFNIEHCAAVGHIILNGLPHAVTELVDIYDTAKMAETIKRLYPDRQHIVYPDASGKNRTPAGVSTSHAILRQAGFQLKVNAANPGVGDRINSMNAMFLNAAGERRYRINTSKCPTYTKCLERQGWVKGEPDKSHNVDHPLDAGGYFVHFNYPLQGKPTVRQYG